MKSPVAKIGWIFGVFAIATLALIVYQIVNKQQAVTCEVCVTFDGRTVCREAVGRDRDSALRTARRHACDYLAVDPRSVEACLAAPPDTESCEGE